MYLMDAARVVLDALTFKDDTPNHPKLEQAERELSERELRYTQLLEYEKARILRNKPRIHTR